ncbi:MAG: Uma2 family endonuclease [Rhodoplanes sp.]|nr:Uma2 family endonuclease [Rhodoplanes sp.]
MTVSAFLAWAEAHAEPPHVELIDGQIVAVAPEGSAHNRTKFKTARVLQHALDAAGLAGETFTNGMLVPIDAGTAYEPDAMVRCGAPLPGAGMIVTDPVIVAEVVSPRSAQRDTGAKLIGYFKLASVRHYLVIDPDGRIVTHHARAADSIIVASTLTAGALRLDPPGLVVEVADLFG